MQGRFIVIEGLEGAGKSTAMGICEQALNTRGIDFVKVREPGGTPLAESLRSLVKSHHEESVAPETELLIMYAARAQLIHNVIKPALSKGQWVLADRHDWSSQAYQGGGRQLPQAHLDALATIVLNGLTPDLVLYLDIEPSLGLSRAKGRGELDRIEQEAIEFFERTRDKYLSLVENANFAVKIDASQTMTQVHDDIHNALSQFLDKVC
ncbi:dTMP kinase [Pseudoalteromonas xiamenensis]